MPKPTASLLPLALLFAATSATASDNLSTLKQMSLDELADLRVSIATHRTERQEDTAAAVSVLTAEDIRRSGATTLPELLRTVPGLNVARISATEWAVSARGFNNQFANKLLVMRDGAQQAFGPRDEVLAALSAAAKPAAAPGNPMGLAGARG